MARSWTDRTVERFTIKPKQYSRSVPGSPGLELRVNPKGRKVWNLRANGKRRQLGVWPSMSLDEARRRAAGPTAGDVTVREAVEYFLANCGRADLNEPRRVAEKEIYPAFGADTRVETIEKRDVLRWIEDMKGRGLTTAVVRYFGVWRSVVRKCAKVDLVRSADCVLVETGIKEEPREDTLTADDIHALWHGLTGVSKHHARIALLTGLRVGTVAQLRFEYLVDDLLRLPKEVLKARRSAAVPVSRLLAQCLEEARDELLGRGGWVLPGRNGSHVHSRNLGRSIRRELGGGIRPHSIRHTMASYLAREGFDHETIKACLQHTPTGVTSQVYIQREAMIPHQEKALEAWQAYVMEVVET